MSRQSSRRHPARGATTTQHPPAAHPAPPDIWLAELTTRGPRGGLKKSLMGTAQKTKVGRGVAGTTLVKRKRKGGVGERARLFST